METHSELDFITDRPRRELLHQYVQAALVALHSNSDEALGGIDPKYVVQVGLATLLEAERFIKNPTS